MDVEHIELSWVALRPDDPTEPTEIFFRAQDVVDNLRAMSSLYEEAAHEALEGGDQVRAAVAFAFGKWITHEADTYDVSIMQAMLEHGMGDDDAEQD
jgi:hypothetical protein